MADRAGADDDRAADHDQPTAAARDGLVGGHAGTRVQRKRAAGQIDAAAAKLGLVVRDRAAAYRHVAAGGANAAAHAGRDLVAADDGGVFDHKAGRSGGEKDAATVNLGGVGGDGDAVERRRATASGIDAAAASGDRVVPVDDCAADRGAAQCVEAAAVDLGEVALHRDRPAGREAADAGQIDATAAAYLRNVVIHRTACTQRQGHVRPIDAAAVGLGRVVADGAAQAQGDAQLLR